MSEHDASDHLDAPADGPVDGPDRVRTGVADVDEVIASVEDLHERPVGEHAGVFEAAHERLRRALDPTDQQS